MPGAPQQCCCCPCVSSDSDKQGPGCNNLTTPTSWIASDSGISICSCTPFASLPTQSFNFTGVGLPTTVCMDSFVTANPVKFWTMPGATLGTGGIAATENDFTTPICIAPPFNTVAHPLYWYLARSTGLWELILSGPNPTVGGDSYIGFWGQIATADPINCCKPLTFTSLITACTDTPATTNFGTFNVSGCFATGGTVVLSPCC